MPIYQYQCQKCGWEWDRLEKNPKSKIQNPKCPNCNSEKIEKKLVSFGILGGRAGCAVKANCNVCSGCDFVKSQTSDNK